MDNFTLKVETAASKAKANPPKKDPLFYILPPLIVAAVFAIVYGVQPPAPAAPAANPAETATAAGEEPAAADDTAPEPAAEEEPAAE